MIKRERNIEMNAQLQKLYDDNTDAFIKCWECCYENKKANSLCTFGIVDVESYDADNGILFICKETRNWNPDAFDFFDWLNTMAIDAKAATSRPQIWYNIGRWAKLINNPGIEISTLLSEKQEALSGLKHIAFTNVNKVYGDSTSGKAFWDLAETNIAKSILQEEIRILNPKTIVVCGKGLAEVIELENILHNLGLSAKIVKMPHPSARVRKMEMLSKLKHEMTLSVEITFENLDFIDIPKDCFEIIQINENRVFLKLLCCSDKPICEFEEDVCFNGRERLFDRIAKRDITHITLKLIDGTQKVYRVPWEDGKNRYENRLEKCAIDANGDLLVEIRP